MEPVSHVPLPNMSEESRREFQQITQIWSAYTGLPPDDPYVVATAHTYGLYDQILKIVRQAATKEAGSTKETLGHILDRLDRLEGMTMALQSSSVSLSGSATAGRSDKSSEHQLLALKGLAVTIKLLEDIRKLQTMVTVTPSMTAQPSAVPESTEGGMLRAALAKYTFRPFDRMPQGRNLWISAAAVAISMAAGVAISEVFGHLTFPTHPPTQSQQQK